MIDQRVKNKLISLFVICWLIVFHYESLRHFYLNSFFKKELPKVKLLYPPAGWVMFYHVPSTYGFVEVYGVKDQQPQLIDPHYILRTRSIGYDNIHRNALVSVLEPYIANRFCQYLNRKFSYFDSFFITYVNHPDLVNKPFFRQQAIAYQCQDKN